MSEESAVKRLLAPPEAAGHRLDQWIVSQLPDVSRVRVQQLIEQEKILVNGHPPKASLRLRGGEEIRIIGAVALPPLKAVAENIPLDVVYEDENIVVVNKPAGMAVHAGAGRDQAGSKGTLVNALLHRFTGLSELGGELRPGIVHRLDKGTSGLMVVAKTDAAHRRLAEQFSRRKIKKTYIALVHGWISPEKGTAATPISRDLRRRERMTTRRAYGREAITHWKTLKKIDGPYGRFSLLEVTIETGRTHQIRVHLSSAGHPVAGDTLYGAPREVKAREAKKESAELGRNFLHAAAIQFKHPVTDTPLSFRLPIPAELAHFLHKIGGK